MTEPGKEGRRRLNLQSREAGEELLRALHGSDVRALLELDLEEDGLARGLRLTLGPDQAQKLAYLLKRSRTNNSWWKRWV